MVSIVRYTTIDIARSSSLFKAQISPNRTNPFNAFLTMRIHLPALGPEFDGATACRAIPDYPAPVIRNPDTGTGLTMMRWSMPPPPRMAGPPVTNIRRHAHGALTRIEGVPTKLATMPPRVVDVQPAAPRRRQPRCRLRPRHLARFRLYFRMAGRSSTKYRAKAPSPRFRKCATRASSAPGASA